MTSNGTYPKWQNKDQITFESKGEVSNIEYKYIINTDNVSCSGSIFFIGWHQMGRWRQPQNWFIQIFPKWLNRGSWGWRLQQDEEAQGIFTGSRAIIGRAPSVGVAQYVLWSHSSCRNSVGSQSLSSDCGFTFRRLQSKSCTVRRWSARYEFQKCYLETQAWICKQPDV
jgi:hypothetical protein